MNWWQLYIYCLLVVTLGSALEPFQWCAFAFFLQLTLVAARFVCIVCAASASPCWDYSTHSSSPYSKYNERRIFCGSNSLVQHTFIFTHMQCVFFLVALALSLFLFSRFCTYAHTHTHHPTVHGVHTLWQPINFHWQFFNLNICAWWLPPNSNRTKNASVNAHFGHAIYKIIQFYTTSIHTIS